MNHEHQRLKIAVTGMSGRFGGLVGGRLHRNHEVVGIDRRPIRFLTKYVEFHRIDIRRKRCESIFREHDFDAVIHLNFIRDRVRVVRTITPSIFRVRIASWKTVFDSGLRNSSYSAAQMSMGLGQTIFSS